jgi:HK97 family phage prohead protease
VSLIEHRSAAVEFRFGNGEDLDGVFDGYANLWDVTDSYGTRFRPGAFRAGGLDERPFALLWMHNPNEVVGTFTASEDERGLRIQGRFAATSAGQDARTLAQMGAASELSVGFIRRGVQDDDETAITAAELVEVSLITARMASQPGAALVAVRKQDDRAEQEQRRRAALARTLRAL